MDVIVHPTHKTSFSIFSDQGKQLLKTYLVRLLATSRNRQNQKGGEKFKAPLTPEKKQSLIKKTQKAVRASTQKFSEQKKREQLEELSEINWLLGNRITLRDTLKQLEKGMEQLMNHVKIGASGSLAYCSTCHKPRLASSMTAGKTCSNCSTPIFTTEEVNELFADNPTTKVSKMTQYYKANPSDLLAKLFNSFKKNVHYKINKYRSKIKQNFVQLFYELEHFLPPHLIGQTLTDSTGSSDVEKLMPRFNTLRSELKAYSDIVQQYTKSVLPTGNLRHNSISKLVNMLINVVGVNLWKSKLVYRRLAKVQDKKNNWKIGCAKVYKEVKVNEKEEFVEYLSDKELNSALKKKTKPKLKSCYKYLVYSKPSVCYLAQFNEIIFLDNNNVIDDADLFTIFIKKYAKLIHEVQGMLKSFKKCFDIGSKSSDGNSSRMAINNVVANMIQGFANNYKMYNSKHLNIMLYGSAGTGKSRYATIIANVIGNLGILLRASSHNIDVISSQSLKGQYLGESAPKTRSRLSKNLENVMFIDEAYQLSVKGQDDKWESYGEEVCTEIVAFLSEHIGEVCVVVAGYQKEMLNNFLKINQGLPRRFPLQIKLDDYNAVELTQLLCYFLNKKEPGFVQNYMSESTLNYILKVIQKNQKILFQFNAGDIENLASIIFEEIKRRKGSDMSMDIITAQALIRRYCIETKNLICNFKVRVDEDSKSAPPGPAIDALSSAP